MNSRYDLLVIGGGLGGCAAALAAASLGKRVLLTEETDWLGGQLTSQAVPPDEHPWIESFGCTTRYRRLRDLIRRMYADHYPLSAQARAATHLNPGLGRVSRLCHEPRAAVAALDQMMAPAMAAGRIAVRRRCGPVEVAMQGDRAEAVTVRLLDTGRRETLAAAYILDATETGELLPLAGMDYVSGAESRRDTGEDHALAGAPDPDDVQALTWCFAMGHDPAGGHTPSPPAQYERWRAYGPQLSPTWPGPMLSWTYSQPITLQPITAGLFPDPTRPPTPSLWLYRRILAAETFEPTSGIGDVTLVNWPQNDYLEGNILDRPEADRARFLEEARQLSLSLLYWLQTEAPRPDGGTGYPGLHLRPDLMGTEDGLAKAPYIRESRRIRAAFTVLERHVSQAEHPEGRATPFADSIGVGYYRIDLHPSTARRNYVDLASVPFQIPLGALIPVRVRNLLPACKNLGVTHITNGCFRLHPVEWNIGESAGLLAAFCLDRGLEPRTVHAQAHHTADFQALLVQQGIELQWPADVRI